MSVSAGRVLMIPKGTYDANTTYNFLDIVYYAGSTYVCKQTTVGHDPTSTTYWQILAQGTQSAAIAGNYYGTCDTAAATAAKVVTIPANEHFVLQVGDIIGVKFDYTNSAANVTINVNSTGAKRVYYDTSEVSSNNLWAGGEADRITLYMYDGTDWVWIGHDEDNDTTEASGINMTGYTEPASASNVSASDTVLQAIGKVEKKADNAIGTYTAAVTKIAGDTSATFTNAAIHTTSLVELWCDPADKVKNLSETDSEGTITFTFDALETSVSMFLHVINL